MGIVYVNSSRGKYATVTTDLLSSSTYIVEMYVNNREGASPHWVATEVKLPYDEAIARADNWLSTPLRLPKVIVNDEETSISAVTVHTKDGPVIWIHAGEFCTALGVPEVHWNDLYQRGRIDAHGFVHEKRLRELIGDDFGRWFTVPEDEERDA